MELFYCPSLLGRAATARRSDAPRRRVQRATEHACCRRLMLSCRAADLSCWTCKTWFEWNLRSACACATRAANVPVQRPCGEATAEQALDVQMIVGSRQKQAITKIRANTWKYYPILTCSYMILTCQYHIRTCSYIVRIQYIFASIFCKIRRDIS